MDRQNPFEELDRLLERMNRQFELTRHGWRPGVDEQAHVAVDLEDHGEEFVLTADLPGFERNDLELTVKGDRVRIRADAETTDVEEREGEYLRRERQSRSVDRLLTLPDTVDESAVGATFNNGVLTVTLPKVERGDGRDIAIE